MRLADNSLVPDWFTPYDAWVLGRLRTGLALQAELSEASAQFHPVALRLFSAPLSDRLAIADEWLRDRPDAEAIRRAVIDTDPTQPRPPDAGPGRPTTRRPSWPGWTAPPTSSPWSSNGSGRAGCRWGCSPCSRATPSWANPTSRWPWRRPSRGAPMPCGDVPDGPASVIIMSAEDDASRTIVPRLIAAGADLSKVHILRSVSLGDGVEARRAWRPTSAPSRPPPPAWAIAG